MALAETVDAEGERDAAIVARAYDQRDGELKPTRALVEDHAHARIWAGGIEV